MDAVRMPADALTAAHPAPAEFPAPGAAEQPAPVGKGKILAFLGAYFGAFLILIVPVASTLALKVGEIAPETKTSVLGVVAGLGALVAMLATPVLGALSDRTVSRFGMRRPWVGGGALAGVAALTVLAFTGSVLVVGAAWMVVQFAMGAVLAGLAAFVPDRVPESQRGKVSALVGISQQIAPFAGLAVANVALAVGGSTQAMFVVPSVLGLLLVGAYVATADDRVLPKEQQPPFRLVTIFQAFAFNPRRNPDFAWAWAGRFFVMLGFAASATYGVYFLQDRIGVEAQQIPRIQLMAMVLSTLLMIVSASVAGTVSDRTGRRKVFVFVATSLVIVSSLLTAFTTTLPLYLVASAIGGLATGAYFAVDLALVTDVLPDKDAAAAKDMGVFNIANALPQSLAPALAPFALAIGGSAGSGGGNYTALFLCSAAASLIGALTVVPIKKVR